MAASDVGLEQYDMRALRTLSPGKLKSVGSLACKPLWKGDKKDGSAQNWPHWHMLFLMAGHSVTLPLHCSGSPAHFILWEANYGLQAVCC
jgi:hypothetical protein